MQKVQRWSQPFCTSTKARDRSAKPATRCGAVSRTAMMSETRISPSPASGARRRRPQSSRRLRHAGTNDADRTSRALPSTRATSGIAANVPGSICAAQPVTKIRASGRARLALRIAWRVWRTASLVTAQLLTMTRSSSSAGEHAHRLALGGVEAAAQGDDLRPAHQLELAGEDVGGGAAHPDRFRPASHSMVSAPPGSRTSTGLVDQLAR